MFDTPYMIATGLATGLVFGFLLQKARVTRYRTILGQFLFTDFTVLKVMLTAIVSGGIGIYALHAAGLVHLHVKALALAANVLGGLIFGVGMAVAGYCPGTGVAAVGDGSRHALAAVAGMVFGAGVYAEVYPYLEKNLLAWGVYGKATLATATGVPAWVFLAALAVIAGTVFFLVERWERRRTEAPGPAPAAQTAARPAHAH